MKCSKCGKEMVDEVTGNSLVGIIFNFSYDQNERVSKEFIQKQIGKYELNKTYTFCFECYLDSLFMGKFGEAVEL